MRAERLSTASGPGENSAAGAETGNGSTSNAQGRARSRAEDAVGSGSHSQDAQSRCSFAAALERAFDPLVHCVVPRLERAEKVVQLLTEEDYVQTIGTQFDAVAQLLQQRKVFFTFLFFVSSCFQCVAHC